MDLKNEIERLKQLKHNQSLKSTGMIKMKDQRTSAGNNDKDSILDKYNKKIKRPIQNAYNNGQDRINKLQLKSQIYDKLSNGKQITQQEEALFMQNQDIMVDFESKRVDNDLTRGKVYEIKDEFGRTKIIPEDLIHSQVGLHVNISSDYKEYEEIQKKGLHMVPPSAVQATDRVFLPKKKRKVSQNDSLNDNDDVDALKFLPDDERSQLKESILKRQQEAHDEWLEIIKTQQKNESIDIESYYRQMGSSHYKFQKDFKSNQLNQLKEIRKETVRKRLDKEISNAVQIQSQEKLNTSDSIQDASNDSNETDHDDDVKQFFKNL